jgi:5-methylcytosine-specific restriction enzyme A
MSRHHLRTRGVDRDLVALVCNDCHRAVHALFTNKTLARELGSVEALLAEPAFAAAAKFIAGQRPGGRVRTRDSKARR